MGILGARGNLPAVIALLALAACKVDSEYEVYVSDLIDVAQTGTAVSAPSEVRIEVTGCAENAAKIMDIVSKYYEVSSNSECKRSGMDTYLAFKTKAPLIKFGSDLPGNIPTGLAVAVGESGGLEIVAVLERGRFAGLEADVKKMDSTASLKINEVILNINNDLPGDAVIRFSSAWVDNTPQVSGNVTVSRRERVSLRLSNVFSAELRQNGRAIAATVDVSP